MAESSVSQAEAFRAAEHAGWQSKVAAYDQYWSPLSLEIGERLLDAAGVYASAGSACAAGAVDPSHVLAAMGLPRERALGALRLSLGPNTTDADIDLALSVIPPAVERLRAG